MKRNRIACVIPNLNGKAGISRPLDTLIRQRTTAKVSIIVVDNGSTDGSSNFIRRHYPDVVIVQHDKNYGFAGGVNGGIRRAMELGCDYVALFNNDASAELDWLDRLWRCLEEYPDTGIATGKLISNQHKTFDSTGEEYTVWGLPFPRGRGEPVSEVYDTDTLIFGATGGASLYRIGMLNQIGLFDEDFFAYYEDVDISFRAQLAGWRIRYVPAARAYHDIGATSDRFKGFRTLQTLKNLPLIIYKDLPAHFFWRTLPRFMLVYWLFFAKAFLRGEGWYALKGWLLACWLLPKKLIERSTIQRQRRVELDYIKNIIRNDLPPRAYKLRTLRQCWLLLRGRRGGHS